MKNAEKPILSISLLTSDRIKTIPRCLDSLTPIREAIPCELIIVDTSKNPEVHELALSYTDNVECFEWCNDFAKARNVGLKKAKGEWFMFIDDDEWFLEPEPLIHFFKSGEYKKYGYAHYRVRNYHDYTFEGYGDGWVTRLIKLQPETAFHSKVHEYLAPYVGEAKSLEALVGHSGYIYVTNEEKLKHFERNSSLLEQMEQEEPENLRWKVQQIQEYRSISAWEKMEEYCEKTLKFLYGDKRRVAVYDFIQIYLGYAIALLNRKKFDKVKEVYAQSREVIKGKLLSQAFMDTCMLEAYYHLEDYDAMMKHAKSYRKAYKTYKKNPKLHETEKIHLILGETFENRKFCGVNTLCLLAELKMGNPKSVYKYYPYLKWKETGAQVFCGVESYILQALIELNDEDMLKEVLQDALSARNIRSVMMKAILDWKAKDEVVFSKILDVVKMLEIGVWYKPYAALLTLSGTESKDEIYVCATDFIKTTPSIFEIPDEIKEVLNAYDIQVADLYRELDFIKWKDELIRRLEYLQMKQVEELKVQLENSALKDDIRFGYFMIIYLEQKLQRGIGEQADIEQYNDWLYAYSQYTTQTYNILFGNELQQMEIEDMPQNYQAAMWLQLYFEDVNEHLQDALIYLGKVVSAYPTFDKEIRYYLSLLRKELIQQ